MMQARDLTDSQKAGQRLMVGFTGTDLNDELRYAIDTLQVGGIILFSRNILSPEQIRDLCGDAQDYAVRCGQPPLFVAIDQEGGVVARLKPPFTQFAGNPAMTSPADAIAFARTTADELNRIGVNMNMAPVLDVPPPEGPSVMLERAFGRDPQWVARMGRLVIEALQNNGIMAVGKHFPGIGRTVLDSHKDLPDLEIDLETLRSRDLIPFEAAIQSEVSGLMLSHIRYTRIDPIWPASISTTMAGDLLRDEIGYEGLVLTDDLDMGAIAKYYALPDIVTQCLSGTVDLLLICHTGPNIEAAFHAIRHAIQTDDDLAQLSHASLARILAAKEKFLLD
ncbi:glycoside hydrolase family 3 N-terminal domain-containing protein [Desulfatitalea tepidiphila]|uniref:glycoside hydrolase family 3 N-terminal domain-containing protein n=1 Tax=Desulfatitalea tepidiphila TaxID=1185843 RepID=UPI000AA6492D|nr:glycoside hydrolase family 3 N-terminal domain-containing protein [Desulfatitalea tepidiphila]